MVDNDYKKRASNLVEKAKKKGMIHTYDNFCKTKEAEKYKVSEEEAIYYTSKHINKTNYRRI